VERANFPEEWKRKVRTPADEGGGGGAWEEERHQHADVNGSSHRDQRTGRVVSGVTTGNPRDSLGAGDNQLTGRASRAAGGSHSREGFTPGHRTCRAHIHSHPSFTRVDSPLHGIGDQVGMMRGTQN